MKVFRLKHVLKRNRNEIQIISLANSPQNFRNTRNTHLNRQCDCSGKWTGYHERIASKLRYYKTQHSIAQQNTAEHSLFISFYVTLCPFVVFFFLFKRVGTGKENRLRTCTVNYCIIIIRRPPGKLFFFLTPHVRL